MGEEEAKKVEVRGTSEEDAPPPAAHAPASAPAPALAEPAKDVAEEKAVIPPAPEEKVEEAKALAVVEKVTDPPPTGKSSSGSVDRDAVLARVETEKRMSLIKAWEDSEKVKAENKAEKKISAIASWENSKKAAIEADQKKMEESLEKKKAEYGEKMKNKIAIIHKEAEEKRAVVEARRGEDVFKVEEMAAKYRATGLNPKKLFGCFSGF